MKYSAQEPMSDLQHIHQCGRPLQMTRQNRKKGLSGFKGIIDSTLREGEQAPHVEFNASQRLTIIRKLVEAGVDEVELGVASRLNTHIPDLLTHARTVSGHTSFALWSRCLIEDIEFAAECRPDILSLSIPVSTLHIQRRLGKRPEEILNMLVSALKFAAARGIRRIAVGLEDATRAEPDFLVKAALTARDHGAFRVRLADTVGIATPAEVSGLVTLLTNEVPGTEIAFHSHNDFGMATANSISALEAGSDWVDATLLGTGERSGSARLEEIAGYLALIRNDRRYNPAMIKELCYLVASWTGNEIPCNSPVIGNDIFTCKTGIHQHGISIDPATYEPYKPECVRAERRMNFGAMTGKGAIKKHLSSLGIPVSEKQASEIRDHIRSATLLNRTCMDQDYLLQLARSLTL